jgi:exodeoxyribonuclease VII small subunit
VTNIIIADDHAVVRQGVKQILAAETDMRVVGEAKNFGETLAVVRDLDWDVLILEQALAAFERGVALTRRCQSALKAAEQKVEMLVQEPGGATTRPFEPGQ